MEPELLLEVREVLTLDQLGEFVAKHHTRHDSECRFVGAEVVNDPYSAAPLVAVAELL